MKHPGRNFQWIHHFMWLQETVLVEMLFSHSCLEWYTLFKHKLISIFYSWNCTHCWHKVGKMKGQQVPGGVGSGSCSGAASLCCALCVELLHNDWRGVVSRGLLFFFFIALAIEMLCDVSGWHHLHLNPPPSFWRSPALRLRCFMFCLRFALFYFQKVL